MRNKSPTAGGVAVPPTEKSERETAAAHAAEPRTRSFCAKELISWQYVCAVMHAICFVHWDMEKNGDTPTGCIKLDGCNEDDGRMEKKRNAKVNISLTTTTQSEAYAVPYASMVDTFYREFTG